MMKVADEIIVRFEWSLVVDPDQTRAYEFASTKALTVAAASLGETTGEMAPLVLALPPQGFKGRPKTSGWVMLWRRCPTNPVPQ